MRNNDEIMDILDQLKDDQGLSISEIARRSGMAKSAISRYFNRTREFPLNRVNDFAKLFHVSPEFILGVGETTRMPKNIEMAQIRNIPLIGVIACGEPITAEQNIDEYVATLDEGLPSGELFYLRAKGDSMTPKIPDGSKVLCRAQPDVENGEIAAVLVNGDEEATLKKVHKFSNYVLLEAINESYEPYVVDAEHPARIVGKAISMKVDL